MSEPQCVLIYPQSDGRVNIIVQGEAAIRLKYSAVAVDPANQYEMLGNVLRRMRQDGHTMVTLFFMNLGGERDG